MTRTQEASRAAPEVAATSTGEQHVPLGGNQENARIGYQVAGSLMAYEGNLIWARSNAFLVAHSIVLAVIALNANGKPPQSTLTFGLPVAGLVFCMVWLVVAKRGADYYTYWILSMRELEERHLAPEVRTISRGAMFASGEAVTVTVGGEPRMHRAWRPSQHLRIMASVHVLIAVFATLYILFLVGAIL